MNSKCLQEFKFYLHIPLWILKICQSNMGECFALEDSKINIEEGLR